MLTRSDVTPQACPVALKSVVLKEVALKEVLLEPATLSSSSSLLFVLLFRCPSTLAVSTWAGFSCFVHNHNILA